MKNYRANDNLVTYSLSKVKIIETISCFGFIEVAQILCFLEFIEVFDDSALVYIRSKIKECLMKHDDKSNYFIPLRELATELDFLIGFSFR
jgi:hypothetical protein